MQRKNRNRNSRARPSSHVYLLCTLIAVCWLTLPSLPAYAEEASEQKALVEKARYTLEGFLSSEHMEWFKDHIKDARGILIIPQFLKGAFFVGGSGGSGVFLARDEKTDAWSQPAFFTLGGASFGFQFGGQASEVILLVMTQKGVNSMISTTFKLGADASIAVGPVGRGVEGSTAPNLSADFLSFTKTKGLFAGVSAEGAVVAARDANNTAYYGKPTSTLDILIRRNVSNPHSAVLLDVLKKATQTP